MVTDISLIANAAESDSLERSSERAIDCPNDVFPVPGGPTNNNIGALMVWSLYALVSPSKLVTVTESLLP